MNRKVNFIAVLFCLFLMPSGLAMGQGSPTVEECYVPQWSPVEDCESLIELVMNAVREDNPRIHYWDSSTPPAAWAVMRLTDTLIVVELSNGVEVSLIDIPGQATMMRLGTGGASYYAAFAATWDNLETYLSPEAQYNAQT